MTQFFFQIGNVIAEPKDSSSYDQRLKILNDVLAGKIKLATESPRDPDEDKRLPESPPDFVKDQPTYDKYLLSLQSYFDNSTTSLKHRQKVFEWQLFSAKLIFITVLVIVASGVYFAAVQFHVELREKKLSKDTKAQSKTEISAGADGIKVSSGVLGVIILTLSLAFFYLYLVYVYPIEEIL